MRKTLTLLAAATLLWVGCSKQELIENASDGVSAVATPTSQMKNGGGNFHVWTEVWFNENNGRMMLKVPPRWTHVALSASVRSSAASGNVDDPDGNPDDVIMEGELTQVGNSRIYRSGQDQFVFGTESYFSLVDVTLTSNTFVDDWQGETAYMQLFLYPSGRTVEQDPKLVLRRTHIQNSIAASYEDIIAELTIVIADDPAQEVAEVKFVPDPIYGNPDDPTDVTYPEPMYLEKTHDNQTLGLSRWVGTKKYPKEDSYSGVLYLVKADGQYLDTNFALLLD